MKLSDFRKEMERRYLWHFDRENESNMSPKTKEHNEEQLKFYNAVIYHIDQFLKGDGR